MSAITEDPVLGGPHVSGELADGEAEIQLRGVSKRFSARRRETLALTDIELGIRKQELQPRVAAPRRRVRDAKIT